MARYASNGAVVDDAGLWYRTGIGWKPLVPGAVNPPGPRSSETREAGRLVRAIGPKARRLGKQLAALIPEGQTAEALEGNQRVHTYESTADFAERAPAMIARGWRVIAQSGENGHVNVRRTALRLAAGGVLFGGISRSSGTVTVTWQR
jgi:hypothetical protein